MKLNICVFILSICFCSCSVSKRIEKSATKAVLDDPLLKSAHVGISIFEPATGKYWYDHDGDKYFVPASNCKIPTCYAAMKYLGDSLVGLRYGFSHDKDTTGEILVIQPTADPTLLHPDFRNQPVFQFLKQKSHTYTNSVGILDTVWKDEKWGSGWSWNDYDADYMVERNSFPIFGNLVNVRINEFKERGIKDTAYPQVSYVRLFKTQPRIFDSTLNLYYYLISKENLLADKPKIKISRALSENHFLTEEAATEFSDVAIPFATNGYSTAAWVISDSLKMNFGSVSKRYEDFIYICPDCRAARIPIKQWHVIHSRPTDSLLKPMMHNSDNFFAEQSLLMVSNERLGVMNDAKIIDTILKTDFKDLPQRPRWVDGSGLSRFDLFTPQDLIFILNKMRTEFGMDRIKNIFATGDEGTLEGLYKTEQGYIYAKTGTLSGVLALSGFLYTKKNKLVIFSIMINNHQSSASQIRRVMEKFVRSVREKY